MLKHGNTTHITVNKVKVHTVFSFFVLHLMKRKRKWNVIYRFSFFIVSNYKQNTKNIFTCRFQFFIYSKQQKNNTKTQQITKNKSQTTLQRSVFHRLFQILKCSMIYRKPNIYTVHQLKIRNKTRDAASLTGDQFKKNHITLHYISKVIIMIRWSVPRTGIEQGDVTCMKTSLRSRIKPLKVRIWYLRYDHPNGLWRIHICIFLSKK